MRAIDYRVIMLVGVAISSCTYQGMKPSIYWIESNAICVHWSDFGKENFETQAIRMVLRASAPKAFEPKAYYFTTTTDAGELQFLLGRVQKVKKSEDNYFLFLFLKSRELYDLFPEGMNRYGDDCYHIELANMIGQGQILMVDTESGERTKVAKSGDYSFYLGPK
jgi:hypothetical protein